MVPARPGVAPSRLHRIPSLDGLRALAILLVVLDHSFGHFAGGGIGVNVFFVLSGFLITSVLVAEREKTGRVALGLFYARRLLRLYPALIAMLVVTVALGCSPRSAVIAATYTTNLFNTWGDVVASYGHTWSLALEEQFYLLWPLLLVVAIRSRWASVLALGVLAVASASIAFLGTQSMVAHEGMITSAVFNPIWQAHGLLIGCALALVLPGRSVPRPRALVAGGGSAVLAVAVLASVTVERHWAAGWNLLAEIAAAAMIAAMVQGGPLRGLGRLFASRIAVWIGERSYGIYLWHLPLITLGLSHGLSLTKAAAIGVPSAFLAATMSFRWVEAPFLRMKNRLQPSTPSPAFQMRAADPAARAEPQMGGAAPSVFPS